MRGTVRVGCGFVIYQTGIILTANHVIDEAGDIEVILLDGRMFKATVRSQPPSFWSAK
jgi:S1-C subfamily serine protease